MMTNHMHMVETHPIDYALLLRGINVKGALLPGSDHSQSKYDLKVGSSTQRTAKIRIKDLFGCLSYDIL